MRGSQKMRERSKIGGDVDSSMLRCRRRASEVIKFTSDITGHVRAREWEEMKPAGVKTLSELFVHSGILATARKKSDEWRKRMLYKKTCRKNDVEVTFRQVETYI